MIVMHAVLRRGLAAAAVLLALASGAAAQTLAPREAHERTAKGEMVLIDLRHPTEWRQTGIGTSATPISMYQQDFLNKLAAATAGDKSKPVALICATGGRSARMQRALARAGYSQVFDVSEGMLGRDGWLKSGLPVKPAP
jgi:rhodanese-related sulfurtransferase